MDDAAAALVDGRRDDARRRATAALAVAGQPFLPASSGPWVEAWRARLTAAHRRAEQIEVEALLGDGAVGEATERSLALVAAALTDEQAARLLMRAHEAAGNRAAALAVHEQLRRRLDDDLGIRPSPETEALHLHLLGEAPAPAPRAGTEPLRVPRAATSGGPFIGRATERSALLDAWQRVVGAGRLEVVVVEGEAGIGKTRLAAEVAVEVAGAGGRVLWGPASPVGGPPRQPLGLLVDAVLAHDPAAGAVLAPFAGDLAAIGVDLGSGGVPASIVDDATADARLGRALAAAFDRGFAEPALLVADDLQLVADDALAALHDVVIGAADRPVLVVVTARHVRGGAARVLSSWERVAPVVRVSLSGWTAAEVAEAIGAAGFGDGPEPRRAGPRPPGAVASTVDEVRSAALVDVVRDRTAGNAVPCGVGADGDRWFYSQPHAVDAVAGEVDPWAHPFDYGASMLLSWFPARRHRWFLVPCCPPNLARLFATVDRHVAEVDDAGDLLVHVPLAARITEGDWDVEVASAYPDDGAVSVTVHAAPAGRSVRVRVPGFAGGDGHVLLPDDGRLDLPVAWSWWETDHRVEGAAGAVHLRRGPVVHCVEGVDLDGVDLRDLVVDPTRPPAEAFSVRAPSAHRPLLRPVGALPVDVEPTTPVAVTTVPYAEWANRGTTTMRLRFPTR